MKKILFILLFIYSFASAQIGRQQSGYNFKDYGGKDDSTSAAANTAILNALISILPVYGADIYFPGGGKGYLFSGTINITQNIRFHGDGQTPYKFFTINQTPFKGATNLYFTSSSANFFSITNTPATMERIAFVMQDLSIINIASSQPTAGNGIYIDSVAQHFSLERVTVMGFWTNINFASAMFGNITDCNIIAPISVGLVLDNHQFVDAGGFLITTTNFCSGLVGGLTTYGIWIKGGGGVTFSHCFFNSMANAVTNATFTYGIYGTWTSGATSDYHLSDLFFENFQKSAIYLRNQSGGIIQNIQIHAIEIAPVNSTGNASFAIDIVGFNQIIIYDVKLTNYIANISHAAIKLDSCNGVDIGLINYEYYNAADSITHVTGLRRIVETSAATDNTVTIAGNQINVDNNGGTATGININSTVSAALTLSKSGTVKTYFANANNNTDYFTNTKAGDAVLKIITSGIIMGSSAKTYAPFRVDTIVHVTGIPTATGSPNMLVLIPNGGDTLIGQMAPGGGGGGTPGGSTGQLQWNNTTFAGISNITTDGTSTLIFATGSGTARDYKFYNSSAADNIPQPAFYPNSGNSAMFLNLIPHGTGFSAGVQSRLSWFNKDFIADATNYERLYIGAAGTEYDIFGDKGGTGVLRPIKMGFTGVPTVTFNIDGTTTWAGNMALSNNSTFTTGGSIAGNFLTTTDASNAGGVRIYKDATPTNAWSVALEKPGGTTSNNLIFASYNGSWTDKATWFQNGNLVLGVAPTDNAGFIQTPANTTTNASFFLNGATADVTSPTNGMLWYNSTAHTLNFRDNSTTFNLIGAGSASSAGYTPSLTNTTNIASSALNQAYYFQIGNIVHVSIGGNLTPTANNTTSVITFSLPVTAVTTTQNLIGEGVIVNGASPAVYNAGILSLGSGTTVQMFFTSNSTGSCNYRVDFTYKTN